MRDHGARGDGVGGDAEHPREVVAATAGKDSEKRVGNGAQDVGHGAHHAVAAERRYGLAARGGLARQCASMVEIAGVHAGT